MVAATGAGRHLEDRHRAPAQEVPVTIHTARPGFIIGKKGATSRSCAALAQMTDGEVHLNIVEVRKPDIDATLVAQSIASAA
jgi:small subunit ribosomal protein S3